MADPTAGPSPRRVPPTWQHVADIPACLTYRPNVTRTAVTACCVGTVLFLINHLDTALAGAATSTTWLKTGASYVVPFFVANVGMLIGSRRHPPVPGRRVAPTWSHPSEMWRCLRFGPNLVRTVATGLVVGTIYFAINHLDTVVAGAATTTTWVKSGGTYLVPFCVANLGVLIGARRHPPETGAPYASRRSLASSARVSSESSVPGMPSG